jgi:2-keto-4-pentenoate hydratase/2-oxohepta-3-ene-1,7-dioic acid hydratase in catechol pathway
VLLQRLRLLCSSGSRTCISKCELYQRWSFRAELTGSQVLGAADDLILQSKVNGEVRQEASTSDLVFGVKNIIAFVSQGTTLEKGAVILTGTPGGVALGMKPPKWLKDGDTVEVSISGIGTIRNQMVFQ